MITVCIDGDRVIALDGEANALLESFGEPITRRASHVEPVSVWLRLLFHALRLFGDKNRIAELTRHWSCLWRINMSPVGGPILPEVYSDRQQAIDAEINWFNQHITEVE